MVTIDNFEYNKAKLVKLFQDMFQGTVEITEEEANDLGLIDEPKLINITEINSSEIQSTIESDIKDVDWNLTNIELFKKIILNENTVKIKLKDEYLVNSFYKFENTDIIAEEGEELHLVVKASINTEDINTDVFATKNGYENSNVLTISLQAKSIFPNYIILSNDVIANKIGNNTYIAHFVPTEDTQLWIYDNANNETNNICNITINKNEEPREPLEGNFWYLSDEELTEDNIPYYAEWQGAEDHKGWRELDPNTDRLEIPYVEMDDRSYVNWCIAVPSSLGFDTIVNTTNIDVTDGFNKLPNVIVNNVEYNVWTIKNAGWRISGFYLIKSNNTHEEPSGELEPTGEPEQEISTTIEWSNVDLRISYVGEDTLNMFPELLMYRNGEFYKVSAVTENKLVIWLDDDINVDYNYFINNAGTYYIYAKTAGARTEIPVKWKVKESEDIDNYRLAWESTNMKISYVGDDINGNLPLLNFFRNDEVIDNPDVHIENLEIYLNANQVDYDYMINHKGTYDIYLRLIIDDIPYVTEEPLIWKVKDL